MLGLMQGNRVDLLLQVIGLLVAFFVTLLLLGKLKGRLPQDGGKAFAVGGELSRGKPTGAGIIFITCFVLFNLLLQPLTSESLLFNGLLLLVMLSGFLDDRAKKPWSEYKKGIIDLALSIAGAFLFALNNPFDLGIFWADRFYKMPFALYIVLAVVLIWCSINLTNCTDGVDGLSGSLSIITLGTVFVVFQFAGKGGTYGYSILLFIAVLLAYLWHNASPSKLLMADAGSRAIGFFIAYMVMKTYNPILYFFVAAMFIVDGGLGLIKVSLMRFFKLKPMKKLITPVHDHMRKKRGWSDTQVVFRFSTIQIIISAVLLFFVYYFNYFKFQ